MLHICAMELIFLGTSAMVPTPERNHSAILLIYNGEGILMDCGESTQKQLKIAKIRPTSVKKILISHLHGDHVLGLPGLMQTLSTSNYEETLKIYGPLGISEFMNNMSVTFVFDNKLSYEVKELSKGTFVDNQSYSLVAVPLSHNIPCLGYSFIEKDRRRIKVPYIKKLGLPEGPLLGKLQENKPIEWKGKKILPEDATYLVRGRKVSFINDTVICNGCNELANGADVLVSEATYTSEHTNKAKEYMHLTAKEAAQIASQNNVKELILTHFSQRYKSCDGIASEAKAIFENTVCAFDFMKKKI